MRRLLTLLLLVLTATASAQIPDVWRTTPINPSGGNFNNRSVIDANLKAKYTLFIPSGVDTTLHGAKDSIGAMFYQTKDSTLYIRTTGHWQAVQGALYSAGLGLVLINKTFSADTNYMTTRAYSSTLYPRNNPSGYISGNQNITISGEAAGTGTVSIPVTLLNSAVMGKLLTGFSPASGTVLATDNILQAFQKVAGNVAALTGSVNFKGTWNASTNTPTLTSSVGTAGDLYLVSVAGTTNLNGINSWAIFDAAVFNGTVWQKIGGLPVDVLSVFGRVGNVVLLSSDVTGALGYTPISLSSLSATAPITYNSSTGAIGITQAGVSTNGFLSSTDWNLFNSRQGAITLTTLGTSGAATFVSNTLNIPQYAGTTYSAGYGLILSGTTFRVDTASAGGIVSKTRLAGYQPKIILTTAGTSGAATLIGNTLNIPQYKGGGSGGSGTVTSIATTQGILGGTITTAGTIRADTNYLMPKANSLTLAQLQTRFNLKQNVLGYTPENVANKAVDFSILNNVLYPSTAATETEILSKINANAVYFTNWFNGAATLISPVGIKRDSIITSVVGGSFNGATGVLTVTGGGGGVTSVSGTANRITSTGGTTPVIDIAATYVGQNSLNKLGTIGTGTWNGTGIDVAHGGTGKTSLTAYAILAGGTTSTGAMQQVSGLGTSGYVLTSNGAGVLPTWQAAGGGTVTGASNGVHLNGATIQSGGDIIQDTKMHVKNGSIWFVGDTVSMNGFHMQDEGGGLYHAYMAGGHSDNTVYSQVTAARDGTVDLSGVSGAGSVDINIDPTPTTGSIKVNDSNALGIQNAADYSTNIKLHDLALTPWGMVKAAIDSAALGGGGVTTVGTFSGSSQPNGAIISGSTITFGPADITNPGMVNTTTQDFIGRKTFRSGLATADGITQAAWGLTGANTDYAAATYVDNTTAAGATVANVTINSIHTPTITASNASSGSHVTYTTAATVSIDGPPTAGANTDFTNAYALNVRSGNVNVAGNINAGSYTGLGLLTFGTHLVSGSLGYSGSAATITSDATNAATVSTIVARDANANATLNNAITNYQTIATAGATTTLTVASPYQTYFTGVTTQNCKLPAVSGLVLGMQFNVVNNSTGGVTVQSSGSNTVQLMAGGTSALYTCISTSGTSAASWNVEYIFNGAGNPAGSNTQVQYNNNGIFGASSDLAWDNSNSRLNIGSPNAGLVNGHLTLVGTQRFLSSTSAGASAYDVFGQANSLRWAGSNEIMTMGFTGGIRVGTGGQDPTFLGLEADGQDSLASHTAFLVQNHHIAAPNYSPLFRATNDGAIIIYHVQAGTLGTDSVLVHTSAGVVKRIGANIHGNSTTTGSATTAVTVTIGSTMANTNYFVSITPQDLLTAVNYYISAKTTTTFTVTFVSALSGSINFDWIVSP